MKDAVELVEGEDGACGVKRVRWRGGGRGGDEVGGGLWGAEGVGVGWGWRLVARPLVPLPMRLPGCCVVGCAGGLDGVG